MVGGDCLSWGHVAVVPCGCPSIFLLLPALGWKLVCCPGPKCALKGRGRDPGNRIFRCGSGVCPLSWMRAAPSALRRCKEGTCLGVHGGICTESCWYNKSFCAPGTGAEVCSACASRGAVGPRGKGHSSRSPRWVIWYKCSMAACPSPCPERVPMCVLVRAPRFPVWEGGSSRQRLKMWMITLCKRNFFPSSGDGLSLAPRRARVAPLGAAVPRAGSAPCGSCGAREQPAVGEHQIRHPGCGVITAWRGDWADPIVLKTRDK